MNIEKLKIKIATVADAEKIVHLNHQLFQEDAGQRDPFMNLDWPLEHGRDYFTSQLAGDNCRCWLAEVEGELVGYLIGYTRPSNNLRPVRMAELESMYVIESHRSSGIGAQLVQTFISWARAKECQRMAVSAYAANKQAIAFYKRLGFHPKTLTLEAPIS
jgi:GNAT superfamily N-acetyltransferase